MRLNLLNDHDLQKPGKECSINLHTVNLGGAGGDSGYYTTRFDVCYHDLTITEVKICTLSQKAQGTSVNDGMDKDYYLGAAIELAYPTIDSFATMVKVVVPGALMYKHTGRSGQTHLMYITKVSFGKGPFILTQFWSSGYVNASMSPQS